MTDTERQARIRAALAAIGKKYGKVAPDFVVKEARNPRHALHQEFVWDNKKAANIQRLDRARDLIARYLTVVVVDKSVKVTCPAYVRDPAASSKEQGYIAVTPGELDRSQAVAIIVAEIDRCVAAITRARNIAGVLNTAHPGLNDQLERMLLDLIETRRSVAA